jgi:predicted SAM-dependent methyltransferase
MGKFFDKGLNYIQSGFNLFGFSINRISTNNPYRDNGLSLYKQLYDDDSIKNKKFYNVGAGSFQHPYWTNLDYYSDWYKQNRLNTQINFDLTSNKSFPIESESANIVYSSHTIEHIQDDSAQNLFNESHRILKSGGLLRLSTPNIDIEYRAVIDNDRHYFYWINNYSEDSEMKRISIKIPMNKWSIKQIFLYHFAAQMSIHHLENTKKIDDNKFDEIFSSMSYEAALNYCTSLCYLNIQRKFPGNHINWWNKDKLFKMLKIAGFNNIYLSAWGQSFSPVLRNTTLFDTMASL